MLRLLPAPLRGLLAALFLALNTLFWCWPLFALSLLKLALPLRPVQRRLRFGMHWIAESWIAFNSAWMNAVGHIEWHIEGLDQVDLEHSYLVTSNHQSWADILMLQDRLNRRMPFLKFFLKHELIWVPVIGLCWWALEFPFMKRFSKEYLTRYPHKRGQDLATTRKACERYRTNPVSVFNFLEGTRFTPAKHDAQNSPYRYLLKPRAGGIAFVIDAMGEQLSALVDITLHYPDGRPSFWDLLCGRVTRVVMRLSLEPIPAEFLCRNYDQDEAYRLAFQHWVNALWEAKDADLAALHERFGPTQAKSSDRQLT